MDKTCKTVSVKRAHAKLTKAAEDVDEDSAGRLLKAVEDFAKRIIPLFEELDLGRKRIQELESGQQTKIRDLSTKARRVDSLEKEVSSLRKSKAELKANFNEALNSAKAFRTKAEELQNSLTDVRKNLVTKEEECRRTMDSLNRFKSSDMLKSKKLKTLKQEVETLSTKLQEKENIMEEQNLLMDLDDGHSIGLTIPAQSSSLAGVHRHSNEDGWVAVDDFRFEGMPGPGFKPSWTAGNNVTRKANTLVKKPQPSSAKTNSKLPLNLDAKGRPNIAVQMGPKSTIRTVQRF
ncbi:hypothetical protein AN958_03984 [Leucoagaricus sp. SymC.cos]|nr:hypothetical protein AN958_03984 [Leucoagaricus sp. SymC.cos]